MRRALTLLLVVLAIAGGLYWLVYLRPPPETVAGRRGNPGAAVPVVVAAAETRDVPIYLDGLGTVQASALVTVKPMVDGKLVEVLFKEGQDVEAGDVLARIDPRSFQATLDQAVAKKRQDEANLANARIDLARYQKLAATAYTSAQQADTQKALVAQLEAQVAQDQAQIDAAQTQLDYTTVRAPVSGRVGIRLVDAGNIVHASDATGLVVITTLKPIAVLFSLPQQSLAAVQAAIAASGDGPGPEVLALPQSGTPASAERAPLDRGTLTVMDNQVDPTTGTIKLKASFPNQRATLWPGAFVTVRLRVATKRGAVVVPPVAVQRGPRGTYVFLLSEDQQSVARRAVTVSHETLMASVIADGLKAGDRVVVDGTARLSDGSRVRVLPPAGTAPDAAPADAAAPVARQGRSRRGGAPG
jgi:multidrug efflux system membrane fusion protein